MADEPGQITQLLADWGRGDKGALNRLMPLVYRELHKVAKRYMAAEPLDHTLQTTAVINEAYMKLAVGAEKQWSNRAHFFAVAAKAMRHVLVDYARGRGNLKRGGNWCETSLDVALVVSHRPNPSLIALDEALNALEAIDRRKAQVVELRFFGGLEEREIAELLKVSVDTVHRDWKAARVWLYNQLRR